jgi:hypothetical protein
MWLYGPAIIADLHVVGYQPDYIQVWVGCGTLLVWVLKLTHARLSTLLTLHQERTTES